jgi:hypothetical protein
MHETDYPKKKNMREVDYSLPFDQLPFWLVPLSLILLFLPLLPLLLVDGIQALVFQTWAWWMLPLMIILILAHEAVHAIAWKLASGLSWSQFKFGFSWKGLAPYCHATAPMGVTPYRIGTVMPAIITGLLPLLLAYAIWSPPLMLLSGFMISAAVGDIFVLWTLRNVPENAQLLDHPSQVGCIAYLPE